MEIKTFKPENQEIIIGERHIEDVNCPNCGGSGIDCAKCHGWGGLFLELDSKEPVDNDKQKQIVEYWKNIGIERDGYKTIQAQGRCECGYEKIIQTKNNPKDFTEAEKEIYGGHDYETDCPHEPGINVI